MSRKRHLIAAVVALIVVAGSSFAADKNAVNKALYKNVAAELSASRSRLQRAVQSICRTRPEVCNTNTSRRPQLACPSKPNCRLPRNPQEVLAHAACIERWLLNCV